MAIGGFKVGTITALTCGHTIGVMLKCSGHNPTPGAQQKPADSEYAMGRDGQRIPVVHFPVNHKNFWLGAQGIADAVKTCWLERRTPLFFDDRGDGRAIAGACFFLFKSTNKPAKEWLSTLILPNRQVADVFY